MSQAKRFSAIEIQKHGQKGDLWLAIHGTVYDVSEFMEDHPGGADALLDQQGIDATSAFEDVGHSEDARELMAKYRIGSAESLPGDARMSSGDYMKMEKSDSSSTSLTIVAALVLLSILVSWYTVRQQIE